MNAPEIPLEMLDPAMAQEEAQKRQQQADEMLLAAIKEREAGATGDETDVVNTERAAAIERYLGRPMGNEIEGRSQVISKDIFDTVEWIKPSLLRIFASGDTVAEFQPQGEEDLDGAQQESDYVDYVIQRKNPWFMIAHEWFTDALLTKNAYTMAYWQDQEEAVLERYQGLTEEQLALIAMDQTVQIVGHRAYPAPPPVPPQVMLMAQQQGMQLPPFMLHDVDVRRVKNYGCAKICVLPPERCLVAQDAKGMSVRQADFFEYWEYKTISALRIDGFNIPDDIADQGGSDKGVVDEVRDSITSQSYPGESEQVSDPSMRKVKARMIWIRSDYDGDGVAEYRYVVAVGDTMLVNRECTGIPVAAIVPYPMPHRHIGLSMDDVLSDLQIIKSVMMRSAIDNQFIQNNGRTAVNKNTVNLDDMLVSRPGGVVRVDGPPSGDVLPFVHPDTVQSAVGFIEYIDGIRQDRGGVSKPYAGADLDSIKAQPGTIAQLTSAASQKIELIARIFGEGVKELFSIVHEITLENPTVVDKVQLRGKWVTVDPRTWKKRSDMTLSVGMGVGNRQQQVVALQSLIGLQKEMMGIGLTSLPKVYNAVSEYTKALGFATGKQFFDEPQPGQQFQPQPPYQVMVAQIKAQTDVMVQQMKNHTDATTQQLKEQAQDVRTWFEENMQLQNDREERMVRMFSEQTDRIQELRLENARSAGKERPAPKIRVNINAEESIKESKKAAQDAAELAKSAMTAVDDMKKESTKKRKRKITAPSGKVYEVE